MAQPYAGVYHWSASFRGLFGDLNEDGKLDAHDVQALLSSTGPCMPPPASCPADMDADGDVDVADAWFLAKWVGLDIPPGT